MRKPIHTHTSQNPKHAMQQTVTILIVTLVLLLSGLMPVFATPQSNPQPNPRPKARIPWSCP